MDSWYVPISTLVPTENAKSLASLFRQDIAKFGQDRDRFSEVEDGTIAYSNCSQNINDS